MTELFADESDKGCLSRYRPTTIAILMPHTLSPSPTRAASAICLDCVSYTQVNFGRSRDLREISYHLRESGRHCLNTGDSRSVRKTWDLGCLGWRYIMPVVVYPTTGLRLGLKLIGITGTAVRLTDLRPMVYFRPHGTSTRLPIFILRADIRTSCHSLALQFDNNSSALVWNIIWLILTSLNLHLSPFACREILRLDHKVAVCSKKKK